MVRNKTNKRGQIFSLMMVFFTLFLCGVVIALFFVQQEAVHASLVSPGEVLMLRDGLTIFELKELELIEKSLNDAEGDFGGDEFKVSFKSSFIDGVVNDAEMTKFLFRDLFIKNVEIREEDKGRNLLEEGIYLTSLMSFEDGKFNFGRANISKRFLMTAAQSQKIDFPVYSSYEFDRMYSIDKNGEVIKA